MSLNSYHNLPPFAMGGRFVKIIPPFVPGIPHWYTEGDMCRRQTIINNVKKKVQISYEK
jgi:hypothetical protein